MTYDEIKPYIENKLVSEQVHPLDPDVRIFNYTQQTQFSKAWDDITRQCRGLIMNVETGEILARPFPKFFNYEEHIGNGLPIPEETPIISGKMDGSLGILYALKGKSWIATRGSFTSEQAVWATEWFHKAMETDSDSTVTKGQTALFEIIYPRNRIVVQYDFSGLVHLATLDIKTGRALSLVEDMWPTPFMETHSVDCDDFTKLKEREEENAEGYVIHFPESDLRLKIKFTEYVRLHKLITGVSEIAIWEHLRDGKGLDDLIDKVPDEFYQWVSQTSNRLNKEFDAIADLSQWDYNVCVMNVPKEFGNKPTPEFRKQFALLAKERKYPGILFAMYDDKPFSQAIWKMIRPHGNWNYKVDIDS